MNTQALPNAPYRGIEPFRYLDRPIFFGREAEVRKILQLITMYRGVLFYGDSGVGKSSLINAGVIPGVIAEGFSSPERVRVQPRLREEFVIQRIPTSDKAEPEYLPSIFAGHNGNARVVLSTFEFKKTLCPAFFGPVDIENVQQLMKQLADTSDPFWHSVLARLSPEVHALIANGGDQSPEGELAEILSDEFDRILQGPPLPGAEENRGKTQDYEQLPAIDGPSQSGLELIYANRRVLENGFRGLIRKMAGPLVAARQDRRLLLIFDQFEEFYTLFEEATSNRETSESAKRAQRCILAVLVDLINCASLRIKLLFVFREDYLAKLSKLFSLCPNLADQRLRLTGLRQDTLRTIIRGPFENPELKRQFGKVLSESLSERLAIELEQKDYGGTINLSEVQIACLRLWTAADPERLYEEKKGVQGLLEDYLSDALLQLRVEIRDSAVALLTRMVTSSGTRNVISKEDLLAGASEGPLIELVEEALVALEFDLKLVRRELRRDVEYFEIVSEFLVPWISQQKAERLAKQKLLEQEKRRRELEETERKKSEAIQRRKRQELMVVAILSLVIAAAGVTLAIWVDNNRTEAAAKDRFVRQAKEETRRVLLEMSKLSRAVSEKQVAIAAAVAERDKAIMKLADANTGATRAVQARTDVEKERDTTRAERDKVIAERDAARQDRDNAIAERDAAKMAVAEASQQLLEASRYNLLGYALAGNRDYDGAIKAYDEALRIKPDFVSALTNRGNAYRSKKDPNRALADYNQALKVDPKHYLAYVNRAFLYRDRKQWDEALVDYTAAIELSPEDNAKSINYTNRGVVNASQGANQTAIEDYTMAIRLRSDNTTALLNRAKSYAAIKEGDKAMADLKQVIALSKSASQKQEARHLLQTLGAR